MSEQYGWAEVASPVGPLTLAVTPAGLARLSFGADEAEHVAAPELAAQLDDVCRQLDEYFAGRRQRFDLPLDWRHSAGPQRDVLRLLHDGVSFGQVVTYQELGARSELGATMPPHEVPRAVGGIMGSNPIAIVVPCHRVIASGGKLGGFGRGFVGGLEIKRRLLALEGALPMTLDDLLALPEA